MLAVVLVSDFFLFKKKKIVPESDTDSEGEELGMIRPALIRELRNVLDEYPDDGQIFKVDRTILLFNSISCNIARK